MPTLKQAKKNAYLVEDFASERPSEFQPNPTTAPNQFYRTDTGFGYVNPQTESASPSGSFSYSPYQQPARTTQPTPTKGYTGGAGGMRSTGASYSTPSQQPQKTTQRQTSTTTYTPPAGPKPEFVTPDYKPVEYDKRRVAALRQRTAAPFRRELTKELQAAFTRSYGSKPERDMAIRNALNQYGTAYGKIMAQAQQTAAAEYAQERQQVEKERLLEFNAATMKAQADFRAAWDAWSRTGVTTTTGTSEGITGPASEGGGEGFFRPYVRATNFMGRESRQYL